MDSVNGLFELCGGFFILLSIMQLHQDKEVKGVSLTHVGFFTIWGIWNLIYYPSLGQWRSFFGGLFVFLTNAAWWAQIIYYSRHPGGRGSLTDQVHQAMNLSQEVADERRRRQKAADRQ